MLLLLLFFNFYIYLYLTFNLKGEKLLKVLKYFEMPLTFLYSPYPPLPQPLRDLAEDVVLPSLLGRERFWLCVSSFLELSSGGLVHFGFLFPQMATNLPCSITLQPGPDDAGKVGGSFMSGCYSSPP